MELRKNQAISNGSVEYVHGHEYDQKIQCY